MERKVTIGNSGTGKTAKAQKDMDEWLVSHPLKKALIVDPKSHKTTVRYFIPNKQIDK